MNKLVKRRRYKYNPYYLEMINHKYIISFIDSRSNNQRLEISEVLHQTMNRFELEDLRQMNEFDRHIEHSELVEETLYQKMFIKSKNIEDIVIKKVLLEQICFFINSLSEIQKRRINLYYFYGLSLKEIAELEGSTHQAISKSIQLGIVKIKQMMKF